MSYQVLVRDKDQDLVGEFVAWDDLSFSERLNNYGTCSFSVPNDEELLQNTSLRVHEIEIRKDGTTVWAGELAHRRRTLSANSSNRVTLTAFTFLEMLNHRYTEAYKRFDAVDQGEILELLVWASQNELHGDLGLTFGTVETTVNRDREYSNFNIMDAFINMSQLIDGIDFHFKPNKEIDILSSKGIDKSAQFVFEWGHNMEAVEIVEDFVHPGNIIITLGAGFGSSQVTSTRYDISARSTYKNREKRVSEIDVSQQQTLDDKGDEVLRRYKSPILELTFKQLSNSIPRLGSLTTGDVVRVKIDDNIVINNRFRIYEYYVTIKNNGKETIEYLVSLL